VTAGGADRLVPPADHPTRAPNAASRPAFSFPAAAAHGSGGALATALPPNVQLMTLPPRPDGTVLLRLSHQFGLGEGAPLSAPVKVDLSSLFCPSALRIKNATEVSLTANQDKASMLRRREWALSWPGADGSKPHPWRSAVFNYSARPLVMLKPMQIKTFVRRCEVGVKNRGESGENGGGGEGRNIILCSRHGRGARMQSWTWTWTYGGSRRSGRLFVVLRLIRLRPRQWQLQPTWRQCVHAKESTVAVCCVKERQETCVCASKPRRKLGRKHALRDMPF
jgi:hypothetical protein